MIQVPGHYPERWEIAVQGINGDGETVTDIWSVSEEEFNRIQVGDYVTKNTEGK